MTCVEYQSIGNIFNTNPFNQAISIANNVNNELYRANKDNLELINKLNGIINNLKNEVKSLKSNEKIVEVWQGDKIITYDRIKNKVTWRYWWADLPHGLIEDLIEEAIKYYYKDTVLNIYNCGLAGFEIFKYHTNHMFERLHNEGVCKRKGACENCEGYNNNGKPCKNSGEDIIYYDSRYTYSSNFDFNKKLEESKIIKYTNTFNDGTTGGSFYMPTLCKRCFNKYIKRGNVFDEWLKDAGYDERNGYCIRIK